MPRKKKKPITRAQRSVSVSAEAHARLKALAERRRVTIGELVTEAVERHERAWNVWESLRNEGYGHHSYNQVFRTAGGRVIHAECGGCSCEGSGSWSVEADEKAAMLMVPEYERPGT